MPATTMPLSVQIFLQRYGIVALEIVRTVDQSDLSSRRCRQQRLPSLFIFIELSKISTLEFIPPRGVVMKPLAQGTTRRAFLRPLVQLSQNLPYPARPQAFHQNSNAIAWRCRFVDPLQLNHVNQAYLRPPPSYSLTAFDCKSECRSPSRSEHLSTSVTHGTHRELKSELTATLVAPPEMDRGTPWLLVADHGRDVAAGLFRVPDFVWEEVPFARIAKLCIAVRIGAFVDHVSLRKFLIVSVIMLYQCEDNEPFVLLLGKQILTRRQAVRGF